MSEMEPQPQTIATLDKLDATNWFERVGTKDLSDAIVLSSWEDAARSASAAEWENIGLEAFNNLREKILTIDKARFNRWNDIVASVKVFSNALVEDKFRESPALKDLPSIIIDCAKWDVLGLCMEAEHLDIVDPGFFHAISYYYVKGHFPCGIDGDPATGTMVVF
ncbi:hypothetical protein QO058_26450 [Bosea vestrisii]|uniref:hypothetical protein n=1 Tax=Bosea vestrisii TaxID=151416 RepID=UPI0024DF54B8|nr:hypothetical protein [Bosea vestrisii]WID96228.1 hypothetical protein QO058_26450 [Bosea vestrisii]